MAKKHCQTCQDRWGLVMERVYLAKYLKKKNPKVEDGFVSAGLNASLGTLSWVGSGTTNGVVTVEEYICKSCGGRSSLAVVDLYGKPALQWQAPQWVPTRRK
jgi:hypothetical protein